MKDLESIENWKKTKDKKYIIKIIDEHMSLIKSIVYRYNFIKIDQEILISEGIFGLMLALDKFDFKREIKFSTYAFFWIKKKILQIIFKNKHLSQKKALIFSSNNKNQNPIFMANSNKDNNNWENFIPSKINLEREVEKQNLEKLINLAISHLTKRESRIIQARIFQSITLKDLSLEFGISKERIRQIESNALEKIRNFISYNSGFGEGKLSISIIFCFIKNIVNFIKGFILDFTNYLWNLIVNEDFTTKK